MNLYIRDESGEFVKAGPKAIIRAAKRVGKAERGRALASSEATKLWAESALAGLEHEVFVCIFLDNRHRVIASEPLSRGTIDGTSVYPREVVKRALKHNAAAVIFAHNHPSGVGEPSRADTRLTERLKDALALVDIRVLDHLIVNDQDPVSFAERGLI